MGSLFHAEKTTAVIQTKYANYIFIVYTLWALWSGASLIPSLIFYFAFVVGTTIETYKEIKR